MPLSSIEPKPSAKAERLGETTKLERRNLIAASMLALTAKAFNIQISQIEVNGNKISFQPDAMAFVALAAIVYFGITFVLYYIIDTKNSHQPAHESSLWRALTARFDARQDAILVPLLEHVAAVLSDNDVEVFVRSRVALKYAYTKNNIYRNIDSCLNDLLGRRRRSDGLELGGFEVEKLLKARAHLLSAFLEASRRDVLIFLSKVTAPFAFYKAIYIFRHIVWDLLLPVVLGFYTIAVYKFGADPSWMRTIL